MTPTQIHDVKQSFALVAPIADQAGALFYRRLFEIDPALRPLFKGEVAAQSEKLMQTIATVVNSLDRLQTIVPVVPALGVRPAGHGMVGGPYRTRGPAVVRTREEGL